MTRAASGHGTYPQWAEIPPAGTSERLCGDVAQLTWDVPGVTVRCALRVDHPSSHCTDIPMHGRRVVDLKPEYGGHGAGTVHMRAIVIWDSPDAQPPPDVYPVTLEHWRSPASPRAPKTIKYAGPTVVLEGGPRDGWVYYADEWDQQQRAAALTGQPASGYLETPASSSRGVPANVVHSHRVWQYRR